MQDPRERDSLSSTGPIEWWYDFGNAPGKSLDRSRLAAREIATYLALTLAFSGVSYGLIAPLGIQHPRALAFVLMWCPGMAAIATRLLCQGNLRGMGWRWGRTRYQLWSYAIPLAYALAAYLIIWIGGFGKFPNPEFVRSLEARFHLPATSAALAIGLYVTIASTRGMVGSCIFALGEELGWRGLLVPELARVTSFTRTALLSGIIWSLWHYPAIFLGGYNGGAPAWYSAACFTIMATGIATVTAWMRIKSGSVWPGVLLHASHNLFIQTIFDPLTQDTAVTRYLRGEFGLALAMTALLTGFLFWRKRGGLPVIP